MGDPLELSQSGCSSSCIYTPENDDSKEYCFRKGSMETQCLANSDESPRPGKIIFKQLFYIVPTGLVEYSAPFKAQR